MDKAIAAGLILTEAVLNSFKHAFDGATKQIKVTVQQKSNELYLSIEDNGKGFADLNQGNFGLSMIKNLVQKSKGTLHLENREGAFVQIVLPI
jgi:two-component sensor histidine kinase